MQSFFGRLWGRKKDDEQDSKPAADAPNGAGVGTNKPPSSGATLLEGKFEVVPPQVSPSAQNFQLPSAEKDKGKDKERRGNETRGATLAVFRSRSRQSQPSVEDKNAPKLSLGVGEADADALGVVFEGPAGAGGELSEEDLRVRRLNAKETLSLFDPCAQFIIDRGLETLGLMHPNWYSASPAVQNKLLSLFINSLSTTSSDADSPFLAELNATRSPQDVATILRWALRHLQLPPSTPSPDTWYTTFADAERTAGFPADAFSKHLAPKLPAEQKELLTAFLGLASRIAAHAESNGVSGSKLCMLVGLWLLGAPRSEAKDDWPAFYARWERGGRILEHVFLAHIRDEDAKQRLPKRLLDLVHHYPYTKDPAAKPADGLLPRPRFATRRHPALFVRVETELPREDSAVPGAQHVLRVLADAFGASTKEEEGDENAKAWKEIRGAAKGEEGGEVVLSRVFADDTLRVLALLPPPATAISGLALNENTPALGSRRRSVSVSDAKAPVPPPKLVVPQTSSTSTHTRSNTNPDTKPPPSSFYATDWAQFSTVGFGETTAPLAETLMDADVEVTQPARAPSRKSTLTRRKVPPVATGASEQKKGEEKMESRAKTVERVEVDEAFVDAWADAVRDFAEGPAFVLCKLKDRTSSGVEWLVVEQRFVRPAPAVSPVSVTTASSSVVRRQPPSPKLLSDAGATKKRFSLFSTARTLSGSSVSSGSREKDKETGKQRGGKGARVNEMGEIVDEEEGEGTAAVADGASTTSAGKKDKKAEKEALKAEKEQKKVAERKEKEERKAAEKAAKEKKAEEERAAKAKKAEEERAAKAKKAEEEKAAKEKKAAEEKAAKDKKAEDKKAEHAKDGEDAKRDGVAPAAASGAAATASVAATAAALAEDSKPAPETPPKDEKPANGAPAPVDPAPAAESAATEAPEDGEATPKALPQEEPASAAETTEVFAPAAVESEPEPAAAPAEPTLEPVAGVAAEHIVEPVPEPAAEPTPEPAAEPVPEPVPVPEAAPEPVSAPAAQPAPEPVAAPVEPEPEPAAQAELEPAAAPGPAPEPVAEAAPETAAEPTPEPAAEPEPVPNAAPEPVAEPSAESATGSVREPALAEPAPEPVAEPVPEPPAETVREPTPEALREPTPEPAREPTPEPPREPTPEPVRETTPEPPREPTPEPVREPTPPPPREPTPEPVRELTPELPREPTPDPVREPIPEPEVPAPPESEPAVEEPAPTEVAALPVPSAEEAISQGLPPAPTSVFFGGETPGPQVALDTSEPAAAAQAETDPAVTHSAKEIPVASHPVLEVEPAPAPELEPVPIVEATPRAEAPTAPLEDNEPAATEVEGSAPAAAEEPVPEGESVAPPEPSHETATERAVEEPPAESNGHASAEPDVFKLVDQPASDDLQPVPTEPDTTEAEQHPPAGGEAPATEHNPSNLD